MREKYGYIKAFVKKIMGDKKSYDEIKYHNDMSKMFYVSEKDIIKLMNRIGRFV